jgi:hypothetical protein
MLFGIEMKFRCSVPTSSCPPSSMWTSIWSAGARRCISTFAPPKYVRCSTCVLWWRRAGIPCCGRSIFVCAQPARNRRSRLPPACENRSSHSTPSFAIRPLGILISGKCRRICPPLFPPRAALRSLLRMSSVRLDIGNSRYLRVFKAESSDQVASLETRKPHSPSRVSAQGRPTTRTANCCKVRRAVRALARKGLSKSEISRLL